MAQILKIETGIKNPVLRAISSPVVRVEHKLLNDLCATLLSEDFHLGLAAPQVGRNERIFVMRFLRGEGANEKDFRVLECINPEIIVQSDERAVEEEGCLSLPEEWAPVLRSRHIRVRFQNRKLDEVVLDMDDLNARVFQHELDHLNGILFVDRVREWA